MISVRGVVRWAVASNDGAILNARAAATECSQARVERAEVERFLAQHLAQHAASVVEISRKAAAAGR